MISRQVALKDFFSKKCQRPAHFEFVQSLLTRKDLILQDFFNEMHQYDLRHDLAGMILYQAMRRIESNAMQPVSTDEVSTTSTLPPSSRG